MSLHRIVAVAALTCALSGGASAQVAGRPPETRSAPRLAEAPPLDAERSAADVVLKRPAPRTAGAGILEAEDRPPAAFGRASPGRPAPTGARRAFEEDLRGEEGRGEDGRGEGHASRAFRDGSRRGDGVRRGRMRDADSPSEERPLTYGERAPGGYLGRDSALAENPYGGLLPDGRGSPAIRHALAGGAGARIQPTSVSFAGADGEILKGQLFQPGGAGPFPAVVALHGCSGLYDRAGELNPRHADWGERLAAQGFLVLMPDSFGSRGLGPQCGTASREVRPGRERVADALAAKAYLQGRRDVKARAVSLLGWSNGGSTVLYAAQAGVRDPSGGPVFARAVAFYPGCRVPTERGWQAGVPLLVLIGGADDWTPPETCQAMVDAARARGEPVDIKVYPGAYHDFDHPGLPVRERHNLAYTAGGDGVAHVGTDPAARADALRRVPAFLNADRAARSGTRLP